MNKNFDYILPVDRIAQRPVYPYDQAKLMFVSRETQAIRPDFFYNICEYLQSGDLLIFNNTAVEPARLFGNFESGGQCELLLVEQISDAVWRCLGRPFRKLTIGKKIHFPQSLVGIVKANGEGNLQIEFNQDAQTIREIALMPIPPYIRKGHADQQDRQDYQTCFAEVAGSIAAPTASLHFTPELIAKIKASGVLIDYLTLHVGTASFLPLQKNEQKELIPPGEERYQVSPELIERIKQVKSAGRRVIAVGTTVVRALESAGSGIFTGQSTKLFIQPGYQFKIIDGMITNLHQPSTTHLLLVQAFLSYSLINDVYNFALENNYRFLSYGDGMLLL